MARRQSRRTILKLETLEGAASTQLRSLFLEYFGGDPGPLASRMFMQGNLSWLAQAQRGGDAPERVRQKLRQQLKKAISLQSARRTTHQPGTRLVREWRGQVYEVTIRSRRAKAQWDRDAVSRQ